MISSFDNLLMTNSHHIIKSKARAFDMVSEYKTLQRDRDFKPLSAHTTKWSK